MSEYVSDTHRKMHDAIVGGIEEYDSLNRAEYNEDAAETNDMRQALAWYDKMVGNYAEFSRRVDSGEKSVEIAALRAEVASMAEATAQAKKELEDLAGRLRPVEEFYNETMEGIDTMRRHLKEKGLIRRSCIYSSRDLDD